MQPDIALNPNVLDKFFIENFSYYNTLAPNDKRLFVRRVLDFILEKNIIGVEGFVANNRVKASVAASAVQLTLGHETWKLEFFKDIVIHPSDFKGFLPGRLFSGETNLRGKGFIRFSWKKFMAGYEISDDNLNLGLHEFSHAMRFSGIKGHQSDYFAGHYFYGWLASAYEAYHDIRNGRDTIFRDYGGTNITEFISVCIEHYFESPHEIKERYPLLYYSTAILLNQETIDVRTKINIRQKAFEEKNKLLKGLDNYGLRTPLLARGSTRWFIFLAGIFILKLWLISLEDNSNPVFLGLLFLIFLRMDFKMMALKIHYKHFSLEKGILFFKRRKDRQIPLSQLVCVTVNGTRTYNVLYYQAEDSYFYEEDLHLKHGQPERFEEELKKNKVAVLKF